MSINPDKNIAIFSLNPDLIDSYGHYLHYDLKIKKHLSAQVSDFYIFAHQTYQPTDNQIFIKPTFAKKTYDDIPLLRYSDLEKYKAGLRKAFAFIDNVNADEKVVYQYMGSVWHAWALAEVIEENPIKNVTFKINIFHDRARLLEKDFRQSSYFAEYDFILKKLVQSPLQIYTDTHEAQAAFEQYFSIKLPYFPMFSVSDFGEINEKEVTDTLQFCYPGNVQKAKGFDVLVDALNKSDLKVGHFKIRTFISYLQKELQAWINDLPKHPNIEVVTGNLSTVEYSKLLQDADVILLPYRAADFGGRTSGIYADAIILEKPVVITRETWGGNYTEKYGNGISFTDGDAKEMQQAIQQIIKEFPQKKEAGKAAKKQWLIENGIAVFSKELLSQDNHYQSTPKKLPISEFREILSDHRPSGIALGIQRLKSSGFAMQIKKTWIKFYSKF
jgi:glycosyltransferase involved in cell wall biosynthesis